jgi:pimeloyl-ACP methyl ester carboxylesterase
MFLADAASRPLPGGGRTWLFDVARRRSVQTLCRLEEWLYCWREITAPSLWIGASEPSPGSVRAHPEEFARVSEQIGSDRIVYIANTGHHIQHDAPLQLAAIVEDFLERE